jgi:Polyglycine hydrolase-like, structural repeat
MKKSILWIFSMHLLLSCNIIIAQNLPVKQDMETSIHQMKVSNRSTIKGVIPKPILPILIDHTLSGDFSISNQYNQYFENTSEIIAPFLNTNCLAGKLIFSCGSYINPTTNLKVYGSVFTRRMFNPNGYLDSISASIENQFPLTPNQKSGTDNILIKQNDGSLLEIRLGKNWDIVNPKPPWWDNVTIQNYPNGTRIVAYIWKSSDCGDTWDLISTLDPANINLGNEILERGRYAVPRPDTESWFCTDLRTAVWGYTKNDLAIKNRIMERNGYFLSEINGYYSSINSGSRFNAIWRKKVKDQDRLAVWDLTRNEFDFIADDLEIQGYLLMTINTFVLPNNAGERFNAIWTKTNEDRIAIWSWSRDDFDDKAYELYMNGYKLMDINAFVLPNNAGERFNAIWTKTKEDRIAVWGWSRDDFDQYVAESKLKGYKILKINSYQLPIDNGDRYNAIWIRSTDDYKAVWSWKRSDFDRKIDLLKVQGYRLIDINTNILPNDNEYFNASLEKPKLEGAFGGWDRIEAYTDPWNGKIYISTSATGGPIIDYNNGKQMEPTICSNFIFQSSDGGISWQKILELRAWTPMIMTSTPNGRFYVYSIVGNQPTLYYTLESKSTVFFEPVPINFKIDGISIPAAIDRNYSKSVRIFTHSISRISIDESNSKIRCSYPFINLNGKTSVAIINVEILDNNSDPIVKLVSIFNAIDDSSSILASTFIESDLTGRSGIKSNTALFYWIEGAIDTTKKVNVRYSIFQDDFNYTNPSILGRSWLPTGIPGLVGHYMYGGSSFNPNGILYFLPHWVEDQKQIRTNIIKISR